MFQPAADVAPRDVNRTSSAADEAPKRKKKKKKPSTASQRKSANEDATAAEVSRDLRIGRLHLNRILNRIGC